MAVRILMAEDDDLLRVFMQELLSGCGHEVDVVENGKQLIDKLLPETYDRIITDGQMPVMNGLEVLKHIKGDERYSDLPVIVCSGDLKLKEEVCKAGGRFVSKPIHNADDLLKKF